MFGESISWVSTILSIFLGIGLAASSGFRVFLPLFFVSLCQHFGWINLGDQWQWVSGLPALITLGIATFVEIIGYYIPFIDNVLDTISIPLATIAGTVLLAAQLGDFPQYVSWGLGIIAGGGTAAAVSSATASTRAVSSTTTAGIGNFAVATGETFFSSLLSFLSVFIPIVAFILVLVLFYGIYRLYKSLRKVKHTQ